MKKLIIKNFWHCGGWVGGWGGGGGGGVGGDPVRGVRVDVNEELKFL